MKPQRISTAELFDRLPRLQVIDVRPIDAYNGWRLHGESRRGHIPGARSLPIKWSRYLEWPEIVAAKQLAPGNTVVVYGATPSEADDVAILFERCGYRDVRVYHDFLAEWCADEAFPLENLPRYQHLVPPLWLKQLIDDGGTFEHSPRRYAVCHTHYQNRADYDAGHIPGALDLDTNTLESPETWNRRSPAEVAETFQHLGIDADTTVVFYGRFSRPDMRDPFPGASAGHIAAYRCAFIALWAGVKDVRVLNGGLQSWLDAGFELSTVESAPRRVAAFGAAIPAAPELAVDLPEAKRMLASDDCNLVCVRSWREYIGETSGYHYIEKKGRIPGAVFANCGSDAYHMENYRNLDHTSREYGEMERAWQAVGITADKHNAFYCGTGWRGSEAFFNAWLLGWPRVSVYDGGWYEWSSDERNPVETGMQHIPAMVQS